jgi:hypothetical protein
MMAKPFKAFLFSAIDPGCGPESLTSADHGFCFASLLAGRDFPGGICGNSPLSYINTPLKFYTRLVIKEFQLVLFLIISLIIKTLRLGDSLKSEALA